MSRVRIIALGNPMGSDDRAALLAAERLRGNARLDVTIAERAGPELLDMLEGEQPALVLDVVRRGAMPGEVVSIPLSELAEAAAGGDEVSSHGLGPAATFKLAAALGRPLPPGLFLGLCGTRFAPGTELSPEAERGVPLLAEAAAAAAQELLACTNTD